MNSSTRVQLALLLLAACSVAGCRGDPCEGQPPSMELTIKLGAGVKAAEIKSLVVKAAVAGRNKRITLNTASGLDDGQTTVGFGLGQDGASGFTASVMVQAMSAANGEGRQVAAGQGDFPGGGDACNFFTLTINKSAAPDGGADGGDAAADAAADTGAPDANPDQAAPDAPGPLPDLPLPDVPAPDSSPDLALPDSSADLALPDNSLDLPAPDSGAPVKCNTGKVCNDEGWCWENPLPQGNHIYGLWGTATGTTYAVGQLGTVLRHDGKTWSAGKTDTLYALRAVRGNGPGDLLAVGDGGTVLRSTGGAWTAVKTGTKADLHGVFSVGGSYYMVGALGTALSFDGLSLKNLGSPPGVYVSLLGVWGRSASEIYAVGEVGTVVRYDGAGKWTSLKPGTSQTLRAVWGHGKHLIAVGDNGTAMHHDGSSWKARGPGGSASLRALWGSGPGDVYAAGDGGAVYRYDGAAWKAVASGVTAQLNALWGSAASDVMAAGQWGRMTRRSGGQFKALGSGFTADLYGVWAGGAQWYAVGAKGTVLRGGSQGWSLEPQKVTTDLIEVWGDGQGGAVAVGRTGTVIQLKAGKWLQASTGTTDQLNAVWGSGSTDIWAAGAKGTVLHHDGTSWGQVTQSATTNTITDLWGMGSYLLASVNAVGNTNGLLVFDGKTWAAHSTARPCSGLFGLSPSLAYLVCNHAIGYPQVKRFKGGVVKIVWGFTPSGVWLNSIHGSGPSNIYVVGRVGLKTPVRGAAGRYDGSKWSTLQPRSGQQLHDVWVRPNGEPVVVGARGTILRRCAP